MEIVPSTFLALAAVLVILIQGPRRGLWAFLGLAPLGAAAAFNLPAVGGATIGMKEVGVLALVLCVTLRAGGAGQMIGALRPGQPGFALLLFMAYSVISALFAPVIFRGATEIFSLSRDANSVAGIVTIPLRPTSGNITQLFSLGLGFLAYTTLAATFRTRPDARAVLIALALTTVFHVLLGMLDVATFATGTTALMEPLRSANYDMLVDHRMMGLKRMIGGFPEASVFGAFSLALFAFWLQVWARAPRSALFLPMMLISLAVLLRSTSSGAYVALVGFLMIFGAAQLGGVVRQDASKQAMGLLVMLVSLLWISVIGLFVLYQLSDQVSAFLDRALLDKLQTSSGVERMSWNTQAFRNFSDTWMLGAGLGSARASNWLLASLSNVGLPGTLLYIWFLVAVLRAPTRHADPTTKATIMGLKAAGIGLMLNDLLTAGSPNQGVFFFALAGLAVGLSRAGTMRVGRSGRSGRSVESVESGRSPISPSLPVRGVSGAVVVIAGLVLSPPLARAEALVAPVFGAASNFGQGADGGLIMAAWRLGLRDLRDAVYWADVEGADGRYRYDGPTRGFPAALARAGIKMSLTVNNPHPIFDGGATPVSPTAVAAFARFASRTVQRFSAIDAVEVGNEMNSARFAFGPGWAAGDLSQRARSYTALLTGTAREVRAARPGVRILGGAAMALPLAWFQALSEAGAPALMDALVLHPYTTPPEQILRQIKALRQIPGFGAMPVEVTEYGYQTAVEAPGYLLRAYCQMALAGVSRAVWYPLNPRGDGWVPLLDAQGRPTGAGRAARLVLTRLAGKTVRDFAPDPFTYGCRFGDDTLLLWGAPRSIRLSPDLRATSAAGAALPATGLALSMAPLLIYADRPLVPGTDVQFGPQAVLADSFDQFGADSPFSWFIRDARGLHPMQSRPGQEKDGVPWTPYLGSGLDGRLMVTETRAVPVVGASVVLRYTAGADTRAAWLVLRAKASPRSVDGITLAATLRGRALLGWQDGPDDTRLLGPLDLREGDAIEVDLGAGADDRGDLTDFRMTLRREVARIPG